MTNENKRVNEAICIRHALVSNRLKETQLVLVRQPVQNMIFRQEVAPVFIVVENSGFPACL